MALTAYTRSVSLRGCNVRRGEYVSNRLVGHVFTSSRSFICCLGCNGLPRQSLFKVSGPTGTGSSVRLGSGKRHGMYNYVVDGSVNVCGAYHRLYMCYCTGSDGRLILGGGTGRGSSYRDVVRWAGSVGRCVAG